MAYRFDYVSTVRNKRFPETKGHVRPVEMPKVVLTGAADEAEKEKLRKEAWKKALAAGMAARMKKQ